MLILCILYNFNIYLFQISDINECTLNTDGCSQGCTNTQGSYYCGCNSGYTLATNGRTCQGVYKVTYKLPNIIYMYIVMKKKSDTYVAKIYFDKGSKLILKLTIGTLLYNTNSR